MAKMKKDSYHGQLVTQGDMDDRTEYVTQVSRDAMIDADVSQVSTLVTPDPTVYGGIISGLVVSRNGTSDYVDVTAGVAIDRLGGRIELASAATVKITNTGSTTEADDTDATGDGAAILLGAPGSYVIVSLWIVYDEVLSNPELDASSTTVYTDITESFHFYLNVGTSYAHPPVGAVDRANLENGAVLLCDLVVFHNAISGDNEVLLAGECSSNLDWDALGANYQDLTGRRSDGLSLDDDTNFPLFLLQTLEERYDSAREGLYEVWKKLQVMGAAAPAGTDLVGSRSMNGNALAETQQAALMAMPAGSLMVQLTALIDRFSTVLYRGGNNTVKPVSGFDGTVFDPTTMDEADTLVGVKANVGGSVDSQFRIGKLHGHLAIPHLFHEDFMGYTGEDHVGRARYHPSPGAAYAPWGFQYGAGGGEMYLRSRADGVPYLGGIADLETAGAINDSVHAIHGYDSVGGHYVGGWNLGASPWCSASFRFYVPVITTIQVVLGVEELTVGNSSIYVIFDTGLGHTRLIGMSYDSIGASTGAVDLVTPLVAGTWYTARISVLSNKVATFQINNGPVVTSTVAGTFLDGGHVPTMKVTAWAGVVRNLYVDQVTISDGHLEADML